jgi:hemerythrin superfamily protein
MPQPVARRKPSRPRAQASRSGPSGRPRARDTSRAGKTQRGMLQAAGSAVGQALRKSTEVVAEAGSGIVNTARGVITSAATGQHDAVSVLKSHHRQVEDLFKQVLSSEDAPARKELMQAITRLLAMHTKIEEDIFYPAVRSLGSEAIQDLVDEAFEEHHVVDLVLAELPRVSPRDDRFAAKMTVLSELVEHHVKEEERDMFRRAQGLGTDRLKALGAQLEQAAARHHGERRKPNRDARGD